MLTSFATRLSLSVCCWRKNKMMLRVAAVVGAAATP
jgi:hypothetical protein